MKLTSHTATPPRFPSRDQVFKHALTLAAGALLLGCGPGPSENAASTETTPQNRASLTTPPSSTGGDLTTRSAVDTDGDGIPDNMDKCPGQPEDMDGFEDGDGCPDPDNDRDGIADVDDRCPNEPGPARGPRNAHGCPARVRVRTAGVPIRPYHP